MQSLLPVNVDVGAALAQPQGWDLQRGLGLEVSSYPRVLHGLPVLGSLGD